MTSNVDQWLEALETIRALDVDYVVPGHGPVVGARLRADPAGRADGLEGRGRRRRREGLVTRGDDRAGSGSTTSSARSTSGRRYMMDHIQNNNAGSLWDKLTATGYGKGR